VGRHIVTAIAVGLICGAAAVAAPAQGLAAPASIGVQDDRLNSPGELPRDRLKLLADSRAKVTRHDVLWSHIARERPRRPANPGDTAYDFDRLDEIVRGFARLDIVPILVVYNTPAWAAARGGPRPTISNTDAHAPDPSQFAAFMRALARRYDGTYRPRGEREPLPEVRHWELWNEPNLGAFLSPQFAGGAPTALRHYVKMVRRAYPVIKRTNRDAVVIAGVAGPRSSTTNTGTGALPWARALARSSARFDAYSQHIYPSQPPRANTRANRLAFPTWRTLPRLFEELDAVARGRGMPVYITEAGYTTAPTPFRAVQFSRAQQAAYVRQIAHLPAVRSGRVPAVIWFNLQDNPNWPSGLVYNPGGYLGVKKPSWPAFRRIAAARALHPDLTPRGRGGAPPVRFLPN
jgi:hypothetical protein